jgi:hypothetical protein
LLLTLIACLAFALGGAGASVASILSPSEEAEVSQGEERSEQGESSTGTTILAASTRARVRERPTCAARRLPIDQARLAMGLSNRSQNGPPADSWMRPRRC